MHDQEHLSTILDPGTNIARVISPTVGCTVVIYSRGRYRTARVTSIGPKRVQVEYVSFAGGTVSRPPQPRDEIYRTCEADDPGFTGVVRQRDGRGAVGQYLETR